MRSTFRVLFYTKNQSIKNGKVPVMGRITSTRPQLALAVRRRCLFLYGTPKLIGLKGNPKKLEC